MAEIIFQIFNKLRNNQIDCLNDADIGGLAWLAEYHPDVDIRNQAIVTLIGCRGAGQGNLAKKRTMKNKKRKKSKKHKRKKSKKTNRSRKYKRTRKSR